MSPPKFESRNMNEPEFRLANLLNQATKALTAGDFSSSNKLLSLANQASPKNPRICYLMATSLQMEGRPNDALKWIRIAARHAPNIGDIHNLTGLIYHDLGNSGEAEKAYFRAMQYAPSAIEPLLNLTSLYKTQSLFHRAVETLKKAENLRREDPVLLSELSDIYRLMRDPIKARDAANRALDISPENALAIANKAWSLISEGKLADALTLLKKSAQLNQGNILSIAKILNELGQAFEARGEFENAWSAFDHQNNHTKLLAKRITFSTPHYSLALIKELRAFYEKMSPHNAYDEPHHISPVFLVGFPRSGTTLLEQILAAHPNIRTSDESPHLAALLKIAGTNFSSWEQFVSTPLDKRGRFQQEYWRSVPGGPPRHSNIFIDKLPQNLVYLGLISVVFPRAKIILAMRDPRDAVISAYKQHFQINPSTVSMLDIESTAEYFDESMRTFEIALTKATTLQILRVKYEDLVADYLQTAADVIKFLELNWSEDLLRYREIASNRNISTPSAEQVIKPVYSSSIGAWKNYATKLERVRPVLEQWATYYGYRI